MHGETVKLTYCNITNFGGYGVGINLLIMFTLFFYSFSSPIRQRNAFTDIKIQFSAYFTRLFFVLLAICLSSCVLSQKRVFNYSPSVSSSLSFFSLPPSSLQNNLSVSSNYKACRPNSFFQSFIGLPSYILEIYINIWSSGFEDQAFSVQVL